MAAQSQTSGGGGPQAMPHPAPPDDLLCPLCHELFLEPLACSPCGHAFCRRAGIFCVDRLFEVRRPADPPGEPPAQRSRDCPLCRAPLRVAEARPEAALAARAEGAFPQLYRQRQAEIQQERARLAARRVEHPTLCFGNLHQLRIPEVGSGNMHDWTFFVRFESPEEDARYIERVVVNLHPTFRPPTLTLTRPPFAVRRLGWGYFTVQAEVSLRPQWGGGTLQLQWLLDFDGEGSMREVQLDLEHRGTARSSGAAPAPGSMPVTPAAGAAGQPGGAGAGAEGEAAAAGGEAGEGEEGEEEGMGSEGEASDAEGSFGGRGGDYDLQRFLARSGWRDSPASSSSGSEGDPTFDPWAEEEEEDDDDAGGSDGGMGGGGDG